MWQLAAIQAGGTALSAYGKYRGGKSAKARAKFEAKQMEANANKAISVSQREAQEIDREGRIQASRALAVAAASGGGASDPTVMNIMGDLAGGTDYLKSVALYEGKERASDLRLSGASSMYSRFGKDGGPMSFKRGWDYQSGHAFPGGPRKLK